MNSPDYLYIYLGFYQDIENIKIEDSKMNFNTCILYVSSASKCFESFGVLQFMLRPYPHPYAGDRRPISSARCTIPTLWGSRIPYPRGGA